MMVTKARAPEGSRCLQIVNYYHYWGRCPWAQRLGNRTHRAWFKKKTGQAKENPWATTWKVIMAHLYFFQISPKITIPRTPNGNMSFKKPPKTSTSLGFFSGNHMVPFLLQWRKKTQIWSDLFYHQRRELQKGKHADQLRTKSTTKHRLAHATEHLPAEAQCNAPDSSTNTRTTHQMW